MRITQSMYYKNLYGQNNSQLQSKLFDVNKQISSGLKIQYAHDNVLTFADTMRLDNEISTLGQIKKSTESGYKMSNQTDTLLNEFDTTLTRTRTLLIQASNGSQSVDSMDAIAAELRGLEGHFKNLANTSINGQFIFSGSAVSTKPIADDGTYMGNDQSMNSFLGSGVHQQYNLSGADLFLGEETLVKRQITTNIPNYSLSAKYPDFSDPSVVGTDVLITTSSTIRDLMGDNDAESGNSMNNHFYISGSKSSGEAFSEHIRMSGHQTVDELLTKIGAAFGNTPSINLVNVSLSANGGIVVEDKITGSSKLEFHIVGAVDFNTTDGNDAGDVSDPIYGVVNKGQIDNLKHGETNFKSIVEGTSTVANPDLYVKSFVKSPYKPASIYTAVQSAAIFAQAAPVAPGETLTLTVDNGVGPVSYLSVPYTTDPETTYGLLKTQIETDGFFTLTIDGDTLTLNPTDLGLANGVTATANLVNNLSADTTPTVVNSTVSGDIDTILYDRTQFTQNGSILSSTTSQVLKTTNAFAQDSTKISEVADISKNGTLDGTQFKLEGLTTNGNQYKAEIDFKNTLNGGSTFSVDTSGDGVIDAADTTYSIFNTSNPRTAVNADDMTYRQLMDVVNMVVTNNLPASDITTTNSADDYDSAVRNSEVEGNTYLTYDGKVAFGKANSSTTKASISLYDSNAGNFDLNVSSSVMTFNSNNALTVRDPKTDFFSTLNEIITSIEEHKVNPDGTTGKVRNVGMENSIAMLDDLQTHFMRSHALVGANSNTLNTSLERSSLLEISTMTLRSSVIDVDLAEASLTLTQLSLNYEAMLSTVGKVSKLSLVNYL